MTVQTLQQYFGFSGFRPGQSEVIDRILTGSSAAAIFPTGSGKSLCYQLPALQLPHLTLVISPLLALMKDQVEFLRSKNIPAACIDSTQNRDETLQIMQQARNSELKILLISVERLKNERFRQFISKVPISLLVVDEAHCISEWGHNFRPDYLKLPAYQQELNISQVLLLTATATPQVIEDMGNKFKIAANNFTITGFYRSNLTLNIVPCSERDKFNHLVQFFNGCEKEPTIVYVTQQKTAEYVAKKLTNAGIHAIAYHAGLNSELRSEIQQSFMQGQGTCIVATIAFGMGIDKADIRNIIHYDLPKSLENYSQEIGRAGRDGQPARCMTLGNRDNLNVLENFVYGDTPDKTSINYVIEQIYASEDKWEVMLNQLSRESNIRPLPLKTLLVYLELNGTIQSQFTYFSSYRFKLIDSMDQIIDRFEGERQNFVQALFNCSEKARTWYSIDFDALWKTYRAERQRVVAAIDYFHEKGWLELETKQSIDVYRIISKRVPLGKLVENLHELFYLKEKNEIARIHKMLDFFQGKECLSSSLAQYFGDDEAPQQCHHCSVCDGSVAQFPKIQQPPLDADIIKQWLQPYRTASVNGLSSKACSRFLCGISTPLSVKLKATKMEGFGKLENYPFAEVNKFVYELLST